jgi:hypothetical protein
MYKPTFYIIKYYNSSVQLNVYEYAKVTMVIGPHSPLLVSSEVPCKPGGPKSSLLL